MLIVKKSGDKQAFDREKLAGSIAIACRKRPVSEDQIERLVSGIQRQLEASGKAEIEGGELGELVMEGLHALDEVAYVRFASVYREFREASDFGKLIKDMPDDKADAPEPKDTLF